MSGDSRPKDNIRILMHVWLAKIEQDARALALGAQTKDERISGEYLSAFNLEMMFVRRVRAFLEENPR